MAEESVEAAAAEPIKVEDEFIIGVLNQEVEQIRKENRLLWGYVNQQRTQMAKMQQMIEDLTAERSSTNGDAKKEKPGAPAIH